MSLPVPAYDPQATYGPGSLVSHAGSAWLVTFPGQLDGVEPGTDSSWARVVVSEGASPVASLAQARLLWPDADTIPDDTLTLLLASAWEACAAFVPAHQQDPWPTPVPFRWTEANVLHARDHWTAYRQEGGVIGFDSYAVRVRPLSDTVKALLRPTRGVPLVG